MEKNHRQYYYIILYDEWFRIPCPEFQEII